MAKKAFLINLAVEGIQKYICSSNKLKEMIGGSEIVNYIASEEFYKPLLTELHLTEANNYSASDDKYIVAQANAGTLILIVFDRKKAESFLLQAVQILLSSFPGLPLYTAIMDFEWENTDNGWVNYKEARSKAEKILKDQRSRYPIPCGSPLMPILRISRLDGLPATGKDDEFFSLPSQARRNKYMLKQSRENLQKIVSAPEGISLVWEEDLQKLMQYQQGKVALICIDGNDLGKLFDDKLKMLSKIPLSESIASLKELSKNIQAYNREAFNYACKKLIEYEIRLQKSRQPGKALTAMTMPLRPLVMGGDDITLIARADISLAFVGWFTQKFMQLGKDHKLSIGIGMVVMPASYPFAKAFPLAESLQDSAKKLTRNIPRGERPSSIDYLVLTEDVENNMQAVRQRLFKSPEGFSLTSKPFALKDNKLVQIIADGMDVLNLPRSHVRNAWTICRQGPKEVKNIWENLRENIARGIGGRNKNLMSEARFTSLFPDNFFKEENSKIYTALGDYLELEHLLPQNSAEREELLNFLKESDNV